HLGQARRASGGRSGRSQRRRKTLSPQLYAKAIGRLWRALGAASQCGGMAFMADRRHADAGSFAAKKSPEDFPQEDPDATFKETPKETSEVVKIAGKEDRQRRSA